MRNSRIIIILYLNTGDNMENTIIFNNIVSIFSREWVQIMNRNVGKALYIILSRKYSRRKEYTVIEVEKIDKYFQYKKLHHIFVPLLQIV